MKQSEDKKQSLRSIIIGSRSSELAIAQSSQIKNLIIQFNPQYSNHPDLISIKTFKTTGDSILDRSLSDIGGKGLFTKEIEEALIAKKIDIAVHSMKDMPTIHPDGLDIIAIPEREDPRDAFISKKYKTISDLPLNSVIGTASTRRKSLLLNKRPDLKIVNFRGNVNTRLQKIENEKVDATILAVAGLNRINLSNKITSIIPTQEMLPAVAQGALGVQARIGDEYMLNLVSKINHYNTAICVKTEREFLKIIDGSCKTPIAAYCYIKDSKLHLETLISSLNGSSIYRTKNSGNLDEFERIGRNAGCQTQKNAKDILASLEMCYC